MGIAQNSPDTLIDTGTKLLFFLLVALLLSGCDQKTVAIQTELRLIEKTVKDTNQPESIRKGAEIFANILSNPPQRIFPPNP